MSDFLKLLGTSAGAAFKWELIPLVTSKAAKAERRSLRAAAVQEIQLRGWKIPSLFTRGLKLQHRIKAGKDPSSPV